MTAARFALYPGSVTSSTDGQRHYLDSRSLVFLYGVSPGDCVVVSATDLYLPYRRDHVAHAATLVPLIPRFDGRYGPAFADTAGFVAWAVRTLPFELRAGLDPLPVFEAMQELSRRAGWREVLPGASCAEDCMAFARWWLFDRPGASS